nr:MAG TPA: hypothetical protein [Caudoviricetes sp.]
MHCHTILFIGYFTIFVHHLPGSSSAIIGYDIT